jgi:hypothetical protein
LAPEAGGAGTLVIASVLDFGRCPSDGDDVRVGSARVNWEDGRVLAVVPSDALSSVPFAVPDDAAPGEHRVTVTCLGGQRQVASGLFTVTAAEEPVAVPEIVGSSLDDARRRLEEVDLRLGRISPVDGGEVVRQRPEAGTLVRPGTAVDVELQPPPQALVIVPDVVGQTLDDAARAVRAVGLELGEVSGEGDLVREQRPPAETAVPVGSEVTLSMEAGVPPEEPVLAGDGAPGWWPAVLLLALAVVLALVLGRAGRERRWVRRQVRVAPGAPVTPRVGVAEERDPSAPTVSVTLQPRVDHGVSELEEVAP